MVERHQKSNLPTFTDDTTSVAQLKTRMQEFVDARKWQRYHTAKNLSMSIAIEAAELMEHFQWLTPPEIADEQFDRGKVEDELADVACYILSFANALEIDLASTIEAKMQKNELKYPPEKCETWRQPE